jgi:hypothetical protein
MTKLHRTWQQHCSRHSYFSMWSQSLSTVFFHLWTRASIPTPYKLLSILCSPDKWLSAVPHDWHNGNLPSFFLKDQTRDNLRTHSRDFKVDVAILSIQNLWWRLWCTYLALSWRRSTSDTFLVDELNKGKHSDFKVFQYSKQEFTAAC